THPSSSRRTATPEIYTLSLHDALPIFRQFVRRGGENRQAAAIECLERHALAGGRAPVIDVDQQRILPARHGQPDFAQQLRVEQRSEEHTSELQSRENLVCRLLLEKKKK